MTYFLQDGDGKISVREFCDMVLGHDNKLIPEEDMEELVAQMDKNGDGLVWQLDRFLCRVSYFDKRRRRGVHPYMTVYFL